MPRKTTVKKTVKKGNPPGFVAGSLRNEKPKKLKNVGFVAGSLRNEPPKKKTTVKKTKLRRYPR